MGNAVRHRQVGQRHAGQALLGDEEALVGKIAAVLADAAGFDAAQHGDGLADCFLAIGDHQQGVAYPQARYVSSGSDCDGPGARSRPARRPAAA